MVHLRIIAGIFIKFLICLIIQNICQALVSDIILELVSRGKDAIDDVANNILEQFEIDGLRIYNDNSELIYSCGEYKRMPDMMNILNDKAFYLDIIRIILCQSVLFHLWRHGIRNYIMSYQTVI